MTQYVKAEEIGLYNDGKGELPILGSRNNGKTEKRSIFNVGAHYDAVVSFYNNSFNEGIEFVKNVIDLSGLRIRKQYVSKIEKHRMRELGSSDSSILEFEDKTKSKPLKTDCAFLFSLPNDGREIFIEDNLYAPKNFELAEEDFNKLKRELKTKKIKNINDIIRSALGKSVVESGEIELRDAYDSLNFIQSNARFKAINDLRYDMHKEQTKIDESKYSEWELQNVEQHTMRRFNPNMPFMSMQSEELIGVFKEKGKDTKYEIPILVKSNALLRSIAQWVDNKSLKDFVKESEAIGANHQIPQKCDEFIVELLQKGKIKTEHCYLGGNFNIDVVSDRETGKDEQRTLLEPQTSYLTLSNGKERRTVETPTIWALILGLENSNILKVKKETRNPDKKIDYVS